MAAVDYAFAELIETLNGLAPEPATMTTPRRVGFGVDAAWTAVSGPNSVAVLGILVATRG